MIFTTESTHFLEEIVPFEHGDALPRRQGVPVREELVRRRVERQPEDVAPVRLQWRDYIGNHCRFDSFIPFDGNTTWQINGKL